MGEEEKLISLIGINVNIKQVKVGNYYMNYAMAGSGPILIMIHGVNIGWGQWYSNIAQLSKHFTVYAIDLLGSGKSSKIDYGKNTIESAFVNPLEEFIMLKKFKSVYVLGHSLGAVVAVKLAHRIPKIVQKLVLISPLGFSTSLPINQKLLGIYLAALILSNTVMKPTKENIKKFLGGVANKTKHLVDEFVDYYHKNIVVRKSAHPFMFMHHFMKGFSMKSSLLIINELKSVTMPTLIILGEKDKIINQAKITDATKNFPFVKIQTFSDIGHVAFIEDSEKFNDTVISFLT